MLFNSGSYLVFLAAVVGVYFSAKRDGRPILLLLANAIFYAWWSPAYALLLLVSTAVDYFAALRMEGARSRRPWLVLCVAVNLLPLLTFKYAGFLYDSWAALAPELTSPSLPTAIRWAAPIGISFYTFLKLGYVIDVYRGRLPAERNFVRFAAFCSFFPLILSGPIERGQRLLPQLADAKPFDYDRAVAALRLFAWGFFKKLVIADRIAPAVDAVFASPAQFGSWPLIAACYLFSIQIYCDFSGYTDIARGSAGLLGYDTMKNFERPYAADSVRDFWRRWHISLSTWFRDYLYFPLGGGRVGAVRWAFNVMVVFLASGLWHGAAWTFVVWGALHGLALIVSGRGAPAPRAGWRRAVAVVATFHFVTAAWVFFKAPSLSNAVYILTHLFADLRWAWPDTVPLTLAGLALTLVFFIAMEFVEKRSMEAAGDTKLPAWKSWVAISVLAIIVIVAGQLENQQFIYFQF